MRDNRRMASDRPYARGRNRRAEESSGRTVGEVAALARVTVRLLHHYDEIGLVSPSGRSDAGYRLYDDADLERLQQALFYRELGFALEDIRDLMTAPDFDRGAALREQRRLLEEQGERLHAMIEAVDAAIAAHEGGFAMNDEEMFEVFGGFDVRKYGAEVEERWGDTVPFQQSRERVKSYRKEDWQRFKLESEDLYARLVAALTAGVPAASDAAMALAEEHRQQISQWFYDCPIEMHRGLAEMYLADERFTGHFESIHEGLAQFVHDAFIANADARS